MSNLYIIISYLSFLLGVLAFIDFSYRNFKKHLIPFYWLLVIFFIPLLGTLLYFYKKPWETNR